MSINFLTFTVLNALWEILCIHAAVQECFIPSSKEDYRHDTSNLTYRPREKSMDKFLKMAT